MATSRKPGPVGGEGMVENIDEGTLVRAASPTPGPMGVKPKGPVVAAHPKPKRQRSHGGLPTLRIGTQGKDVRWLQVLLNQRGTTQPELKVDGYFGPMTLTAVVNFQRSVALIPDGVVGKQTWLKVVTPGVRPPKPLTVRVSAPETVVDWPLSRRFEEVLRLSPNHMVPELAVQFRALLAPENLGIIAGTLAVWAVAHAFGAGEAVDAVLLALGVIFIGVGVFTAGEDIGECLMITLHAEKPQDLDKAADYLAQAIAILGVVAFFSLVAKVGAKFGRAAGAAEKEAAGAAAKPELRSPKPSIVEESPEPSSPAGGSVAAEVEGGTFRGVKLRVRPGASDKVAVIGRSMGKVVEPYAEGPGAKYQVETFSGDQISPSAQMEWKNLKSKYAPDPIPEDVARDSQMFQENQAWAQKLKDEGYTVIDADNPDGQAASPFYEMEKQILFGDTPAGVK